MTVIIECYHHQFHHLQCHPCHHIHHLCLAPPPDMISVVQARKLKGVIDLDQCEQVSLYFVIISSKETSNIIILYNRFIFDITIIIAVFIVFAIFIIPCKVDTGLTYQSGRVSYQFMFDIKTPKRVYYLAADNEADMTAWVDWVCQVN